MLGGWRAGGQWGWGAGGLGGWKAGGLGGWDNCLYKALQMPKNSILA